MKPGQKKEQQKKQDQLTKQQQQQQKEKQKYGPTRNNERETGKPPESRIGELYQRLIARDQWGLLPRKMQDKIRNSQDKEPPPKYRRILKRYYERLAKERSGS